MARDIEKDKIVLESRQSIYNYPKRIYRMWGYELPIHMTLTEAVYFVLTEVVIFITNWAFHIPTLFDNFVVDIVIKFGLIPYFLVRAVKYSRLDGKSPYAFIRDYISFFFDKEKEYFMFRDVSNVPEHEEYIIDWWCSSRHRLKMSGRKKRRARN